MARCSVAPQGTRHRVTGAGADRRRRTSRRVRSRDRPWPTGIAIRLATVAAVIDRDGRHRRCRGARRLADVRHDGFDGMRPVSDLARDGLCSTLGPGARAAGPSTGRAGRAARPETDDAGRRAGSRPAGRAPRGHVAGTSLSCGAGAAPCPPSDAADSTPPLRSPTSVTVGPRSERCRGADRAVRPPRGSRRPRARGRGARGSPGRRWTTTAPR